MGQTCSVIFLDIIGCILAASYTKDKIIKLKQLHNASVKLDMLKLLIRLAKDCDCLANKEYLELQSKVYQIGKMLGGWIKSLS